MNKAAASPKAVVSPMPSAVDANSDPLNLRLEVRSILPFFSEGFECLWLPGRQPSNLKLNPRHFVHYDTSYLHRRSTKQYRSYAKA